MSNQEDLALRILMVAQDNAPSYVMPVPIIYLYICSQCGWWDISPGVDELFPSFVRHARLRTDPCEKCGHAPMTLLKRTDSLHIAVDAAKG